MSIKTFFSKLFGKKEELVIEEPFEVISPKSGREVLIEAITENTNRINDFFTNPQKYEGTRFNARETKAIYEIYKRMLKSFRATNNYINVGFRNVEEYLELKRLIQDLMNSRDEYLRDLAPQLKARVDELSMALRNTAYQLNKNLTERRKIQEIFENESDKKKFFEYSVRFKETTDAIRARLAI